MLAAIDAGEIDAIIVYHGDRLIRQPFDLETLISIADQRGIRIASPSGTRDLGSADDRFILRIEAAQACRESDNISRRVRRALSVRVERGQPVGGGRRPFGWGPKVGERVVTTTDGREETRPVYDIARPVPREQELLREAVDMILAGASIGAAVRYLNQHSTTTMGNTWTIRALKNLLVSPRIAGLVEHQGTMYRAVWEPVISGEEWEQIRAIFRRLEEANAYDGRERRYLLSGIAMCYRCESTVRVKQLGSPPRRSYACLDCRGVTRDMAHVDAHVQGRVLSILSDPRLAQELAQVEDSQASSIRQEIARLTHRRDEARAAVADLAEGDVDPALLLRGLASIERRLTELRTRLATSTDARLIARMVGISEQQWEATPIDTRAATIRALVTVTLLPSPRGRGFHPKSVEVLRRPLQAHPGS